MNLLTQLILSPDLLIQKTFLAEPATARVRWAAWSVDLALISFVLPLSAGYFAVLTGFIKADKDTAARKSRQELVEEASKLRSRLERYSPSTNELELPSPEPEPANYAPPG